MLLRELERFRSNLNAFYRTQTLLIERIWSNAFNRTLLIKGFQSNAFNQRLSIERIQSNAIDWTHPIKRFQSNAFDRMLLMELERFWSNLNAFYRTGTLLIERIRSNAFNRKLSIKRFQSNAFNQMLSIERFQSNAFFDQTLLIYIGCPHNWQFLPLWIVGEVNSFKVDVLLQMVVEAMASFMVTNFLPQIRSSTAFMSAEFLTAPGMVTQS